MYRRPRFSLRALFLVILVISAALGTWRVICSRCTYIRAEVSGDQGDATITGCFVKCFGPMACNCYIEVESLSDSVGTVELYSRRAVATRKWLCLYTAAAQMPIARTRNYTLRLIPGEQDRNTAVIGYYSSSSLSHRGGEL